MERTTNLMTSRFANLDKFRQIENISFDFVEFQQYLNSPVMDRKEYPLKTWQHLKALRPHLYQIALKYLVVVGTSVPRERLLSKAGNIITEKIVIS